MLTLTWGADILFYEFRPETGGGGGGGGGGMNLKNTLCTMPPSLGGDFMQSLSSFLNIFSGDPHFDALIIGLK